MKTADQPLLGRQRHH